MCLNLADVLPLLCYISLLFSFELTSQLLTQQVQPQNMSLFYEHPGMSRQFQQQHLEATSRAQLINDGYVFSAPRHHTPLSSQNNYVIYNVGSGLNSHLPRSHNQQTNYSHNQLLPNATDVNIYSGQSTQKHLHSELLRNFCSIGYRGDQVSSVIQKLEDNGHCVDFNAVLAQLNVLYSGGSQRAFD